MTKAMATGPILGKIMAQYTANTVRAMVETEKEVTEIEKTIAMTEQLFPTWAVMLCLVQHAGIPYVSSNSKEIVGYTVDQFLKLSLEAYFDLIHPQDIKGVHMAFRYMREFTTRTADFDPKRHRFVFHYRLRQPNGTYIYLYDEKIAIQNQQGRYIFFTLFRNLSQEKNFTHVILEIYQLQKSRMVKMDEYAPGISDMKMSNREKQIVSLISNGLSNKEISQRLSISINTVKSHRQNLFKKFNVKNSLELVSYAQKAQLI